MLFRRRRATVATPVTKSDAEWRAELSPQQYKVLREAATDRPFSGETFDGVHDGEFRCAGCDAVIFRGEDKFDSGTGWPSFVRAASDDTVTRQRDVSLLGVRTEVRCATCDGHLGHVFRDGPHPTGDRFCINQSAIDHDPT